MKSKKTDPTASLIAQLRKPDLSILGNAIRSLPPTQWQDRMFFTGASDHELKGLTGSFPATFRPDKNTHPVFILQAGSSGHTACPCSSSGDRKRDRYIQINCQLEMKANTMNRDSFLIERFRFTLPLDHRFYKTLHFFGRVPIACIQDLRTHQR